MKANKILALLFISAVLISSAASCSGKEAATMETTFAETDEEAEETEETEETVEAFTGVAEAEMDGKNFRIMTAGWWNYEPLTISDLTAEELNGESLNDAIYQRMIDVQTAFDCTIEDCPVPDPGQTITAISKAIMADDSVYDIILLRSWHYRESIVRNYIIDMKEMPNVDFDKPWWNQSSMEQLSINNTFYGLLSDITMYDERSMFCMYFNKNMVQNYNLDDVNQLILDGNWTYDKMFDMGASVASDLNGDGEYTFSDQYGISFIQDSSIGILYSSGVKFAEKDADDMPVFTFVNDRNYTIYMDVFEKLYDKTVCYNYQDRQGGTLETDLFTEGRALFCMGGTYYADSMRVMEDDFGIIPFPKYDDKQEVYISGALPNAIPMCCIPITNNDLENTGIFMEYFAYLGYKNIRPAYYDILLQGKVVRDEISGKMLDMIFENTCLDIGVVFDFAGFTTEMIYRTMRYELNIASFAEKYAPNVELSIEQLREQVLSNK